MIETPRIGVEGFFTIELVHRSGLVKGRWKFKNLIVDAGLNAFFGGGRHISDLCMWCGVGTGVTAPDVAQTQLVSQVGARVSNNGGIADVVGHDGSGNYDWRYQRRTRVFMEADAGGANNLTEVGFFTDAAAGTMWSRSLILDDLGNPTVIPKTADDQVRVTYEVRVHLMNAPVGQIINVNAVDYTFTTRVNDADAQGSGSIGEWNPSMTGYGSNVMPIITANPDIGLGTQAASSLLQPAYVAGTFYRDVRGTWDPGFANFAGGFGSWMTKHGGNPNFAMGHTTTITPKLPKTNVLRLRLTHRFAWGRL